MFMRTKSVHYVLTTTVPVRMVALLHGCVALFGAGAWGAEIDFREFDFERAHALRRPESMFAREAYAEARDAFLQLAESAETPAESAALRARAAVALGHQEGQFEAAMREAALLDHEPAKVYAMVTLMTLQSDWSGIVEQFGDTPVDDWGDIRLPARPRGEAEMLRTFVLLKRGRAFEETEAYERAERDLSAAVDLVATTHSRASPDVRDALYRLARLRTRLDDTDGAFEANRRIAELGGGGAQGSSAVLDAAGYLRARERYDEAIAMLRSMSLGNTAGIWYARAMLQLAHTYRDAGRLADAEQTCAQALDVPRLHSQYKPRFEALMADIQSDTVETVAMEKDKAPAPAVRTSPAAAPMPRHAALQPPRTLDRTGASAQVVLVEAGKSLMPIVVFDNAPPKTRRAAGELADYIEKVSGARPEVIEGTPDPIPAHAIWVGYQPKLEELFPENDFNFQHAEEILIAANDAHLVIAGRDRWDPDHLILPDSRGRGRDVVGVQQEYGTCNAVYTFLQDCLGVRWLFPGELGEDVIAQDTIAFTPFTFRYHPQFRGRSGLFTFSALQSGIRPGSREWVRVQRLQLDSMMFHGGHAFSGWWDRFGETHPEYFALQPDGTRGGSRDRMAKLCKSNPAVWDQWLADVEADIERNPAAMVFGAGANDGAYHGYCVCENCRAWDHPDAMRVRHFWRGVSLDYVAQTDRQITFANTLGRMLKARFPDREYFVRASTYNNSHPVPVGVMPDDNVIVSVFANIHNRPPAEGYRGSRKNLSDWVQSGTRHLTWRANMGGRAGWQDGFPNVAPRRVIEDFRFVASAGNMMGVFFDSVWEHWANQGPHYYMIAQMGWNPHADGEAILLDYYWRKYGPAADTMMVYWDLLDKTSDEILFDNKPIGEVWNAEFHARGYELLDQAVSELADGPEIYRRRVAFTRAGLDYLRLHTGLTALNHRIRRSNGKDAEALAQARPMFEQIVAIYNDYPFALGTHMRPAGRMRELNPDNVVKQSSR